MACVLGEVCRPAWSSTRTAWASAALEQCTRPNNVCRSMARRLHHSPARPEGRLASGGSFPRSKGLLPQSRGFGLRFLHRASARASGRRSGWSPGQTTGRPSGSPSSPRSCRGRCAGPWRPPSPSPLSGSGWRPSSLRRGTSLASARQTARRSAGRRPGCRRPGPNRRRWPAPALAPRPGPARARRRSSATRLPGACRSGPLRTRPPA